MLEAQDVKLEGIDFKSFVIFDAKNRLKNSMVPQVSNFSVIARSHAQCAGCFSEINSQIAKIGGTAELFVKVVKTQTKCKQNNMSQLTAKMSSSEAEL